jgi:hypothetical protein
VVRAIGIGSIFIVLVFAAVVSEVQAQFNQEQTKLITETAASICNTVKELKGKQTDVQIQGEVGVKLRGFWNSIASISGTTGGKFDQTTFEGLKQDATAVALGRDQDCRERVFDKMFAALSGAPRAAPATPPAPMKTSWKLCFGEGGGNNCSDGADMKIGCDAFRSYTQASWDELATNLCGAKDKMTKVQTQNNGGGGCGWTAYILRCKP